MRQWPKTKHSHFSPKAQGILGKRRWRKQKSQGMGRRAAECDRLSRLGGGGDCKLTAAGHVSTGPEQ